MVERRGLAADFFSAECAGEMLIMSARRIAAIRLMIRAVATVNVATKQARGSLEFFRESGVGRGTELKCLFIVTAGKLDGGRHALHVKDCEIVV